MRIAEAAASCRSEEKTERRDSNGHPLVCAPMGAWPSSVANSCSDAGAPMPQAAESALAALRPNHKSCFKSQPWGRAKRRECFVSCGVALGCARPSTNVPFNTREIGQRPGL